MQRSFKNCRHLVLKNQLSTFGQSFDSDQLLLQHMFTNLQKQMNFTHYCRWIIIVLAVNERFFGDAYEYTTHSPEQRSVLFHLSNFCTHLPLLMLYNLSQNSQVLSNLLLPLMMCAISVCCSKLGFNQHHHVDQPQLKLSN